MARLVIKHGKLCLSAQTIPCFGKPCEENLFCQSNQGITMKLSAIQNQIDQLHEEYQEEMRKIEQAIAESQVILTKLLDDLKRPRSIEPIDQDNDWSN